MTADWKYRLKDTQHWEENKKHQASVIILKCQMILSNYNLRPWKLTKWNEIYSCQDKLTKNLTDY